MDEQQLKQFILESVNEAFDFNFSDYYKPIPKSSSGRYSCSYPTFTYVKDNPFNTMLGQFTIQDTQSDSSNNIAAILELYTEEFNRSSVDADAYYSGDGWNEPRDYIVEVDYVGDIYFGVYDTSNLSEDEVDNLPEDEFIEDYVPSGTYFTDTDKNKVKEHFEPELANYILDLIKTQTKKLIDKTNDYIYDNWDRFEDDIIPGPDYD